MTDSTTTRRRLSGKARKVTAGVLGFTLVAGAGAAVAALAGRAGITGQANKAGTFAAVWALPTSSLAFGDPDLNATRDCAGIGVSGGLLAFSSGAQAALFEGEGCAYGARLSVSGNVKGYISGITPDPAHPLPAGWRVSVAAPTDAGRIGAGPVAGCGFVIDKDTTAGSPTYLVVENVGAAPGTVVDLTGWAVEMTPTRSANLAPGDVKPGVSCSPVVGA